MGQLHFNSIPDAPTPERVRRLEEIRETIDAMIRESKQALEASNQPELFEDNSNSTS